MNQDELIKKADLQKIVAEGAIIYNKIKDKYEPKENGKFLAIDIVSKDVYFSETSADAVELARKSHPKKVFYVVKIGFEAAETMAQMFFAK
jgi:hydrogenase maturation factor